MVQYLSPLDLSQSPCAALTDRFLARKPKCLPCEQCKETVNGLWKTMTPFTLDRNAKEIPRNLGLSPSKFWPANYRAYKLGQGSSLCNIWSLELCCKPQAPVLSPHRSLSHRLLMGTEWHLWTVRVWRGKFEVSNTNQGIVSLFELKAFWRRGSEVSINDCLNSHNASFVQCLVKISSWIQPGK